MSSINCFGQDCKTTGAEGKHRVRDYCLNCGESGVSRHEMGQLRERLAAAVALVREVREAYRSGYQSDCVPFMRLLYLSDRWDEEAKEVCGE